MTKTLIIPWTNKEKETILEDWELFVKDEMSLNEIRAKYRGRSRSALSMKVMSLRDKARTSDKAMIERLRQFGCSDEDVTYILHGSKAKLTPDQVNMINDAVTKDRNCIFQFAASNNDSSIRVVKKF